MYPEHSSIIYSIATPFYIGPLLSLNNCAAAHPRNVGLVNVISAKHPAYTKNRMSRPTVKFKLSHLFSSFC
jgi:hypothetical protein